MTKTVLTLEQAQQLMNIIQGEKRVTTIHIQAQGRILRATSKAVKVGDTWMLELEETKHSQSLNKFIAQKLKKVVFD